MNGSKRTWSAIAAGLGVLLPGINAFAASAVEEVVVTAQRTEESIQDVPIAVSAFTGAALEEKQIINPSDLQMNTPNVSFTATNFGGSNLSIRGIGNLLIGTGDPGVSIHLNEIAMPTNLPATEFYDMERIEILRGPQGTLFGKNATGGVVNMITVKPDVDAASGNIDLEYGNYDDQRAKGAINVPITDTFAVRVAGMRLKRDGFIENTANGQIGCQRDTGPGYTAPCAPATIQGIDNDIDGRDLYTFRITGLWNMTENSTGWLLFSKFHENDDKVRITNQICQRNTIPVQGCTPNGFGFDTPNSGTTTGGIFGGLNDAVLLGEPNPPGGFPVTQTGFRKQHTDFEPVYKYDEELFEANYQYNFDEYTVTLSGGYQTATYMSQQDYYVDTGFNLEPTAANPTGYWPTSAAAGMVSKDWTSSQCNWNDGTAGIFGGCQYPANTTRFFAYDQADSEADYWTAEIKVNSSYDGPLNFLIGANYSEYSDNTDYYVNSNSLDIVGVYGVAPLGFPPLYPTMYDNTGGPNGTSKADSKAVFGEIYYQVTDDIKITAGLRYNDDSKQVSDTSVLFNSLNTCAIPDISFAFDCTAGPVWQRTDLAPLYDPASLTNPDADTLTAIQLATYYNVFDQYLADLSQGTLEGYIAAVNDLSGVPPVPGFNEQRVLTGSPDKSDWQETTGRFGVDWRVATDSMIYAFYTRGYKPGGFNPAQSPAFVLSGSSDYTFKPEKIDAYEIGTKNGFLDGGLIVNGSVFYYDYTGLQVSRIANNNSINDNIDAVIYGAELEVVYIPAGLPALQIDAAYSYLNTSVDNSTSTDPLNRTADDPNYITLENIDPGSLTGVNYVANVNQITPALIQQAFAQCGALASAADGNANATCTPVSTGVPVPVVPVADGTTYPNGIPAYFSRSFLDANGVITSDGFETDIDGNQLPNAPENTVHIGVAYTLTFSFGTVTPRIDYYWQDDSYGREFNTVGDQIDSWDQWNASIMYASSDGRWEGRAWIRNIEDEDNVTGHYLTSDTSGFFRNYFLTEPRIYGASFKYNFGALQ